MVNEIKPVQQIICPVDRRHPCCNNGPIFYSLLSNQINLFMGNLLYIIAVILIIGWAIGFLGYAAGGLIHILLVIAVILFLVKLIGGSSRV